MFASMADVMLAEWRAAAELRFGVAHAMLVSRLQARQKAV